MEPRRRFPKSRRLRLSVEFQRVRSEGKSLRGELMTLGFLQSGKDAPGPRAGFITSRRVGSAVLRNRTRRRLREIFRKHQHALPNDIWIVVIARPTAARAAFRALEDEWLRLARRASILAP